MLGGVVAPQVAQGIGIPPVTAQNRLLPPWSRIARCLRAHPSGFTTLVAKQPVHEQARVQSCALLREQWTYPLLHLSQRRCPQLSVVSIDAPIIHDLRIMVTHGFRNQTNVPAKNHNCNAKPAARAA